MAYLSTSVALIIKLRMLGLMNDKLERLWNDVVVTYFKASDWKE
jgi:hypothetical protein